MNRLNRHNTFRNFVARFAGICYNTPGEASSAPASGGDPGGGGGGGTPSPAATPSGGQQQQDAGHSAFGNSPPPSAADSTRVSTLLAAGNANPETSLSMDDIAALVRFDAPFTPKATPAAPVVPNAATVPPAPAAPAAPAAPTGPQLSPDAKAIVDALRTAGLGQPAPAPAAAPEPAPAAPVPYYGGEVQALQVTPQILSALVGSEDPAVLSQAAPAVNTLVNGIMNRVVADMRMQMQSTVAAMMQTHIPQVVQQQQQTHSLETQFYGTHKHLDKPTLKPLVNQISALYRSAQLKTDPNFAWTPEHFNTVAALVSRQFERMYGVPLAGAGPVTTNAPPATPAPAAPQLPYMSSGSTRPPVVQPNQNQSADLLAFV